MRILYTVENLVELFKMDKAMVQRLTRLGIIPSLDTTPIRYDKKEIDAWVDAGNLEKHRVQCYYHPRGVWA